MAVFDEAISQPPLSWAFGVGDETVASDGAVDGADDERPEPAGGSDHRPDHDLDR